MTSLVRRHGKHFPPQIRVHERQFAVSKKEKIVLANLHVSVDNFFLHSSDSQIDMEAENVIYKTLNIDKFYSFLKAAPQTPTNVDRLSTHHDQQSILNAKGNVNYNFPRMIRIVCKKKMYRRFLYYRCELYLVSQRDGPAGQHNSCCAKLELVSATPTAAFHLTSFIMASGITSVSLKTESEKCCGEASPSNGFWAPESAAEAAAGVG